MQFTTSWNSVVAPPTRRRKLFALGDSRPRRQLLTWMDTGVPKPGDVDGDGDTDLEDMVELVDIYKTVADVMGVPLPSHETVPLDPLGLGLGLESGSGLGSRGDPSRQVPPDARTLTLTLTLAWPEP